MLFISHKAIQIKPPFGCHILGTFLVTSWQDRMVSRDLLFTVFSLYATPVLSTWFFAFSITVYTSGLATDKNPLSISSQSMLFSHWSPPSPKLLAESAARSPADSFLRENASAVSHQQHLCKDAACTEQMNKATNFSMIWGVSKASLLYSNPISQVGNYYSRYSIIFDMSL